jgi:general secretion pathway protein A
VSESFVRFFTMSEAPFSKEISDADLWLPPSKQEVVEEVCEAVQEHAQVLLVGEPGAGKTCVMRAVCRWPHRSEKIGRVLPPDAPRT